MGSIRPRGSPQRPCHRRGKTGGGQRSPPVSHGAGNGVLTRATAVQRTARNGLLNSRSSSGSRTRRLRRFDLGMRKRPGVGYDPRRRVARVKAMPLGSCLASPGTVLCTRGSSHGRAGTGAGNCRSIACSVNRFVNRTWRDSTRRGRRSRRSETRSVPSAEVIMSGRDCPRRQRHTSYGS